MKLNKFQKNFSDNIIKFADKLYKQGDSTLLELLQAQKINRDKLLAEIGKVMVKYKIDLTNGVMDLTPAEKNQLYKELGSKIETSLNAEIKKESLDIGDLLHDVGEDKYGSSSYLLGVPKYKPQDQELLDKVINKKIDGEIYSDRIWDNKVQVAKDLKSSIKDFLNGNVNLNDIEKIVKDKYNANAYQSKRLVVSEVGRVQNEVSEQWRQDYNVDSVMWMATLEGNTCAECAELDGQVWKNDEEHPQPIIDTHPLCRCCLTPIPSADYKPDTRMDNETKNIGDWEDYQEWKNN